MRSLERITFLVAITCLLMSAGEVLAGPGAPPAYVACDVSTDGAGCTSATLGKACALNKTCTSTATKPCTCT